ncbi:MAG: hypothetical protein LBI94_02200, partial [Treponema sp.]|nr:hypothetical protein [Treponema sp.]
MPSSLLRFAHKTVKIFTKVNIFTLQTAKAAHLSNIFCINMQKNIQVQQAASRTQQFRIQNSKSEKRRKTLSGVLPAGKIRGP